MADWQFESTDHLHTNITLYDRIRDTIVFSYSVPPTTEEFIFDKQKTLAKMTVVDVHTHMYPPAYMELLRARDTVPYVRSFSDNPEAGERLVILPAEETGSTSRGRPIGSEYFDVEKKIQFMETHGIDISVISLANPWLDWLPAESAAETARVVNDDVERMCGEHEGKLYAFGTLPLSASADEVVNEIERLKSLKHCRGVVMGTSGLGSGLE